MEETTTPAIAGDTTTEQPSIAALMASKGVVNSTEQMVAAPVDITERKEEPKATQEPNTAATATEGVNVEKASETPSPTVDEPTVPTPQKEVEQQVIQSWQEVLKSQQPDTVLKELGFNDKVISLLNETKEIDPQMVNLLNHWKANGDMKEYLRELETDYSKMSSEDVMRNQIRNEYPKASEAQLNILFQKKIVDAYGLDPDKFSEEEVESGKLLLDAEADKYRDSLISKQQQFLIPKAPEPKQLEPDPQEQERVKAIEDVQKQVKESSYTRSILANKAITIGEGDEKFNFPIEAESVLDLVLNGDTTGELTFNIEKQNGKEVITPKTEHQVLVATVNKYGMNFINELAKHYKSIGAKTVIDPINNSKPPENGVPSSNAELPPATPAEAMARQGRYTSGG